MIVPCCLWDITRFKKEAIERNGLIRLTNRKYHYYLQFKCKYKIIELCFISRNKHVVRVHRGDKLDNR